MSVLESMTLDELWSLYEEIGGMLTDRIRAEKREPVQLPRCDGSIRVFSRNTAILKVLPRHGPVGASYRVG